MPKWVFGNGGPDGRLYIRISRNQMLIVHAVDALIDALQEHSASDGDQEPFELNTVTGEVQVLDYD